MLEKVFWIVISDHANTLMSPDKIRFDIKCAVNMSKTC